MFSDTFNFLVYNRRLSIIPNHTAQNQVDHHIEQFRSKEDGPNDLLIVYCTGHVRLGENKLEENQSEENQQRKNQLGENQSEENQSGETQPGETQRDLELFG